VSRKIGEALFFGEGGRDLITSPLESVARPRRNSSPTTPPDAVAAWRSWRWFFNVDVADRCSNDRDRCRSGAQKPS